MVIENASFPFVCHLGTREGEERGRVTRVSGHMNRKEWCNIQVPRAGV